MDQFEEPPPKKRRVDEKKQMASGGTRKSNHSRGSKQRTKEVSANRQSLGVKSQKSDDKNLTANAGHTPYNFENQGVSGGTRPSQQRHHAEKPLPKAYQSPFDGQNIDFYNQEDEQYSKKVEKAIADEDNVEEIFGIKKRGNRDIKRDDGNREIRKRDEEREIDEREIRRADEEMDIEPVVGGQP